MGWTFYNISDTSSKGKKSEIDSFYNKPERKVLKSVMVGSTYYAAIKTPTNIYAVVYLTKTRNNDYYNFGYKDMSEDMGPYYYECPVSILKLLSKTDDKLANEWRENCIAYQTNKKAVTNAPVGTIITWINDDGDVKYAKKVSKSAQFKTSYWRICTKEGYVTSRYMPKRRLDYLKVKIVS